MNLMSKVGNRSHRRPPADEELNDYVCWSRMQAEAGQGLQAIVARKELERRAGQGFFMWGVGNAPALATSALSRIGREIPVVFSIMKSKPKAIDVAPSRTFVWRRYFDNEGVERALPENVLVTSRGDAAGGPKRSHFALMCTSQQPLKLEADRPFHVSAYRNAGGTGAPVGASQVTALLRRTAEPSPETDYQINLRAWLTGSYWVRLSDAVEIGTDVRARLETANLLTVEAWLRLAADARVGKSRSRSLGGELLLV